MHIISGEFKGRSLFTPLGNATRPAMGKTRAALFSSLEAHGIDWPECNVLDLFAGTGSLAFEALSRGAPFATLVELGHEANECINKNILSLELQGKCQLIVQDVLRFLRKPNSLQYNIIFIDPPYRANMGSRTLQALAKSSLLTNNAIVAAEIETGAPLAIPAHYDCLLNRQFGQTSLYIWKIP